MLGESSTLPGSFPHSPRRGVPAVDLDGWCVGVIKGAGTANGRPMLILGLAGENVARLAAGEPIRIQAAEMEVMGLPAIEVLIVYGKTEGDIMADLRGAGLASPGTPVVHRECTSPTCDHPDHPRGVRRGLR